MEDIAIGRRVRTVRLRLRLRQSDVAVKAGVSQDTVSRVERGRLSALQVSTVRAVLNALEIELRIIPTWRGGELDRLLDEDHAAVVGVATALLERHGWVTAPEVSYSVYGERGSIDLVAWHPGARILLVIEVKTSLVSLEETLRRHDAKVRLGERIVGERFGWRPSAVARLMVLPDLSTTRRQVARHDVVLRRTYPLRGAAARHWLAAPRGATGLLIFSSPTPRERGRRAQMRPRRVRAAEKDPDTPPGRQ